MENLNYIVLIAVTGIAGYYASRFLFKQDTAAEGRKRAAFELAGTLRKLGLTHIPAVLGEYSISNYSGLGNKIVQVAKLFTEGGEEAVVAEFEKVFDGVLTAKLKTETGRAFIAARLTDAATPADVSMIAKAPKAKAEDLTSNDTYV